jgi:hypothetical protein
MVRRDDRLFNSQKEMTVTSKRAILVMSVLGLLAMTLSAQTPTRPGAQADPFAQPSGVVLPNPAMGQFGMAGDYQSGWAMSPYATVHGQSQEEMQLAHQCDSLVKQLAKAEGQDKDKVKAKLAEAIDKQFDLRQKRHETEIAALENQIKKLKEMVQKRQENRKDIVSKRLDQLVRESEGLGW